MTDDIDAVYYNAVDQIFHADWVAAMLAHQQLLRQSIRRLWPEGHPTRMIQVAGTSGKGSVVRLLEAGLGHVGRAGALTSPHLYDYRERISIGGEPAARRDIVAAWETRIRPHCVEMALAHPEYAHSVSDVTILLALALFEQHAVAWAVLETGLGGRYDQVTALDVELAVLTNVGRDHQDVLGSEPWQRALDKAGVCRPGTPLFTAARDGETLRIIRAVCAHEHAPLHVVGDADARQVRQALAGIKAAACSDDTLLRGEHQIRNAALALAVLRHLAPELSTTEAVHCFARVRFAGRFEPIGDDTYVDIAHNAEKIGALAQQLMHTFPDRRKTFVIGLSGARDAAEVFPALLAIADSVIVTTASYKGRAAEEVARELARINQRGVPIQVCAAPAEALALARHERQPNEIVVLTGSAYSIEQALNPDPYMRHLNATWGWRYARASHGPVR